MNSERVVGCGMSSYREEDSMDRHCETSRVWSSYLESVVAQTHCPQNWQFFADSLSALSWTQGLTSALNLSRSSSWGSSSAGSGVSPFLEASETVADDEHPGKGIYGPVAPQQIVVQSCATVWHVEDSGLASDTALAFLWKW